MREKYRLILILVVLVLPTLIVVGCSRSLVTRRQSYYERGVRDFDRQKYPEAIISFSRALQIDPRFADAHYQLAQCHMREGNWTAAIQELQRTIELQPKNWRAQVDLGQIILAGGKHQPAKDQALAVLRSDPKNLEAELLLSNADALLGNLKDARQEAQDAITLAPDQTRTYVNLAIIEQKAGAGDEAESRSAESSVGRSFFLHRPHGSRRPIRAPQSLDRRASSISIHDQPCSPRPAAPIRPGGRLPETR